MAKSKAKKSAETHLPDTDSNNTIEEKTPWTGDKTSKSATKVFVGSHGGYVKYDGVLGAESIALEIEGDFELIMPNGDKKIIENDKLSFCTCGQSKNKPFCDQTHQRVHNVVEGEEDVWDQMDDYERIQTLISIKKSHMDFRLKERKDLKFGDYARMKEIGKEITEEMLENDSE